jgi:hypothetical protein
VDGVDGAADAGDVAVSRESRDDGAVDDAVPDDAVPDDAVPDDAVPDDAVPDDAVKVGRRSPGEKTEGPGASEPELGGGAMIEAPGTAREACLGAADPVVAASSESEASPFADGLNQLVVAAMACLTAWRPLSSTPLAVETRPSE